MRKNRVFSAGSIASWRTEQDEESLSFPFSSFFPAEFAVPTAFLPADPTRVAYRSMPVPSFAFSPLRSTFRARQSLRPLFPADTAAIIASTSAGPTVGGSTVHRVDEGVRS